MRFNVARGPNLFPEPERLLDQLDGDQFRSAFGRAAFVLDSIPVAEPSDVGAMVWDVFVATKFAPSAVRLAYRGEVLQPQQRAVRGKTYVDPQRLMEALQLQQTLNMMGIERFRTDIRAITSGLEERFEVPCPANLYVSYEGSTGGYGPHRDQHDVIVVQLYGEKIWKIYPPGTAGIPIRKTNVTRDELRREPFEAKMTSGSCLYVPAGFAHDVVSNEGCSVHLTFGIQCLRWHDLMTDILSEASTDMFFERLPIGAEAVVAAFRVRIAAELARAFSDDAVARMAERYQYFGSLARHKARVVRSIMAPSKNTDR